MIHHVKICGAAGTSEITGLPGADLKNLVNEAALRAAAAARTR